MTSTEIKALLNQRAIPKSLQDSVLRKSNSLLEGELDVEVVVSTKVITIDVYDQSGQKEDSFNYRIPNGYEDFKHNWYKEEDICGL